MKRKYDWREEEWAIQVIMTCHEQVSAGTPKGNDALLDGAFGNLINFRPQGGSDEMGYAKYWVDQVLFELGCYQFVRLDSLLFSKVPEEMLARQTLLEVFHRVFGWLAKEEPTLWEIADRRIERLARMLREGKGVREFHTAVAHNMMAAVKEEWVVSHPESIAPIFNALEMFAIQSALLRWEKSSIEANTRYIAMYSVLAKQAGLNVEKPGFFRRLLTLLKE